MFKNKVLPRDYMQDRSNLPELNFEPTFMYVGNDMSKKLELMIVVGKYGGYFLAFNPNIKWLLGIKINCELFRFAIQKEEAEKIAES